MKYNRRRRRRRRRSSTSTFWRERGCTSKQRRHLVVQVEKQETSFICPPKNNLNCQIKVTAPCFAEVHRVLSVAYKNSTQRVATRCTHPFPFAQRWMRPPCGVQATRFKRLPVVCSYFPVQFPLKKTSNKKRKCKAIIGCSYIHCRHRWAFSKICALSFPTRMNPTGRYPMGRGGGG